MKLTQFLLPALATIVSFSAHAGGKAYQAGEYKVDPMHSKVGFEVPHLVISSVEGRFGAVEGTITMAKDFIASKVVATADTGSIDTGVKDRDDHLRGADFFDTQKFPKITFKSESIKGKPESFKMTGDLTIKGVTKKVTFDGRYLGSAKDVYGNEKAAFTATTKINRKDFGLTWNKIVEVGPAVGDQVTIDLKIQGARVVEQETKAAKN